MKFTYDGKDYMLKFSHVVFENSRKQTRQATLARIYEVVDGVKKNIVTGYAECSRHDNYNKATGRELALVRAVEQVPVQLANAAFISYIESGANISLDFAFESLATLLASINN